MESYSLVTDFQILPFLICIGYLDWYHTFLALRASLALASVTDLSSADMPSQRLRPPLERPLSFGKSPHEVHLPLLLS
jgi:hypothetical protein